MRETGSAPFAHDAAFDLTQDSRVLIVRLGTEDGEQLQHVAQIDRGERVGLRAEREGAPVLGVLQVGERGGQRAGSSSSGRLASICQSSSSRPRKVEYRGSTRDRAQ